MNLVWLLSIFVLCVGAIDGKGALNPGVVNIGVILSFSTIDGRVSNISLRMAEQDVNSDPSVLGGRRLSLKMHDASRSGFLSIMGALQFMETDSVAIIGPQSAVMAHVLSHLANELQVPFLSYTALDPTMSPLQYPFFVQTAPHDLFLMAAIAEMVSYFRWGEVIAIFSDDDQSRNGITTLGDKLDERRCKISYKAALPPSERATRDDVEKELLKIKMMESRVIVLHTLNSTGRLVFNVAQSLGMTKAGYVWIASSWLSTALDSTSPLPKETTKSIQGAITFRLHVPDSKRKRDFVSRFKKLSNGTIGLNPFGLYAYDTVWILARALKLFFDDGNNISFSNDPNLSGLRGGALNLDALSIFDGGKLLLDKIIKTNTTGLTGPVWFNADRSFSRPSYDIVNVVGDGDHLIGYWSNYSGLSVVPPEKLYTKPANRSSSNQKLNKVVWPGGVTETPRGWVFPYNGRKLRIGVPNRFSYKAIVAKNGSEVQGYCIDVFLAAIKQLPYAVPHRFIPFGDGQQNPDYNELTKKITTGEFDAVAGDIAIVTNRTRMVDFTQPYIESGLVVVTKVRKPNSSAWAFLRPFTPLMWAVTGIFFLVVGAVVWILEHRINDDFRGPPKKQIVTMLWFSFSTMFFAHRENTVSTLGRIVLIIWLFVVLIINSSYTASLTSILTVQQLSSPIKGIDSLITSNQRIGYQVGSFAKNYLMEELSIPKSRLVALGSPEAYAQALENGTVVAVVDERPYVDIFLTEHCDFTIRGQEFTKSGWGFAFPRDSPLAMDLSTAILTLSENGQLQKIHNKWLSKESCASEESDTDSDQLHLQSFWGLFLICGIACFLALVIYFSLMFREFKKYGHGQTNDPPSTLTPKSTPRRLQKFFSFADERVDTSKLKRKRGNDVAMNGSYRNEDGPRNGSGRIHVEIDNNPHRRNFDGT